MARPKKGSNLTRINTYITEKQKEHLDVIAKHDDTTTSEMIRRALDGFIVAWAKQETMKQEAIQHAKSQIAETTHAPLVEVPPHPEGQSSDDGKAVPGTGGAGRTESPEEHLSPAERNRLAEEERLKSDPQPGEHRIEVYRP